MPIGIPNEFTWFNLRVFFLCVISSRDCNLLDLSVQDRQPMLRIQYFCISQLNTWSIKFTEINRKCYLFLVYLPTDTVEYLDNLLQFENCKGHVS